jgi:hypothetical protein
MTSVISSIKTTLNKSYSNINTEPIGTTSLNLKNSWRKKNKVKMKLPTKFLLKKVKSKF